MRHQPLGFAQPVFPIVGARGQRIGDIAVVWPVARRILQMWGGPVALAGVEEDLAQEPLGLLFPLRIGADLDL